MGKNTELLEIILKTRRILRIFLFFLTFFAKQGVICDNCKVKAKLPIYIVHFRRAYLDYKKQAKLIKKRTAIWKMHAQTPV